VSSSRSMGKWYDSPEGVERGIGDKGRSKRDPSRCSGDDGVKPTASQATGEAV
jgi:hypothetical protein